MVPEQRRDADTSAVPVLNDRGFPRGDAHGLIRDIDARDAAPGTMTGLRRGAKLWVQQYVANPLDKLAFALRVPPPGDALLETTGRRTGRPRVTPVCDCLEGDTFWIVAQDGRDAGYVRNLEANPLVRVKGSLWRGGWRTGTAHIVDDDDAEARMRMLGRGNRWRRLCLETSGRIGKAPLTIRIDLVPAPDERSRPARGAHPKG
jgi:deazaflavin-dependent oxidoreductase (nitroreductase family)